MIFVYPSLPLLGRIDWFIPTVPIARDNGAIPNRAAKRRAVRLSKPAKTT